MLRDAEVAEILHREYGLTVEDQKVLGGEVDQNWWVRTSDDREFLLKVSRGKVDDAMRWQERVLRHLETGAPEVPTPRLVAATAGDTLLPVARADDGFVVRLLTWLPGTMVVDADAPCQPLLVELGRVAARLTRSLATMETKQSRSHEWDLRNSHIAVEEALSFVADREDRELLGRVMGWFDDVKGVLETLPKGVVHHDLNDFNVLVRSDGAGPPRITGVLDVGDALYTARVAEVAIAVAYAMLRQHDPLWAASAVVRGFHSIVPLTTDEIAVIFPLAAARLCVNATVWTRRTSEADNPYGKTRMRYTWPALRKVAAISPRYAEVVLRSACGLATTPDVDQAAVQRAIEAAGPVTPLAGTELREIDLTPAGSLLDDAVWTEPDDVESAIASLLADRSTRAGFMRHLSPLLTWSARRQDSPSEPATLQLGASLLVRAGTAVRLPLAGACVASGDQTTVVRHELDGPAGELVLWSCWSGLTAMAKAGDRLDAGDELGTAADATDKSGLGPTVRVQLLADEQLALLPPPARIRPREARGWAVLSLDPAAYLGLPAQASGARRLDRDGIVSLRDRRLARSQRTYYKRPPNLVRGRGVWLYDDRGYGYLDAINNVTHVGHANPRVVDAAATQMKKLNTNSRFVYEGIATYAQRLVSTLPAPLEVVFLVCTGSEANDLALRMARQVTGRNDVMVIDGAYHGNTTAVMGVSPNRYKGPGGRGAPETTHEVITPDLYRGPYLRHDTDAGTKYAANVADVARGLVDRGRPPAAFIAESLMGTAGHILFPDGYLRNAFDAVRAVGGLCISDEVQVGVGRLGTHFWGFQAQGVVPDIVTMGKPLGNGHPLAAVVTTREIAAAFDDGVKYFNTFGGNPVSCAIGAAVLDIVEGDGLQEHALNVGGYFAESLATLKARHEIVGDVRSHGLYIGIELVRDQETKEPAAEEALVVSELMKDAGVIVYPTGARNNILKIKPPMIFGREHVDLFVETLDGVLARDLVIRPARSRTA